MNACTRSSSLALGRGPNEISAAERRQLAHAGRRVSLAGRRRQSGSLSNRPPVCTSSAPSSSWTRPARCGAQPRHAAELQRVRRLVQRDPAQQLVGVGLELIARVGEVGRDEQQPRGRVGVEHGELVLAEHAAAEEAGDRAGLGRQEPARGAAEDAHARARLLGRGLEHAAHRARGSRRSTGRGRRPRPRAAGRRRRVRCRRATSRSTPPPGRRRHGRARDHRRAAALRCLGRSARRATSRSCASMVAGPDQR